MATHDYIISNASGASVRADLNNALAAIVSNNSNATSPATTYAFQFWADTTTGQLKIRNAANSAWITLMELDGTMLMEDGTVSAPGLAFASDLDTGLFREESNRLNFSTGGVERFRIETGEVVVNDPSNDVDFRVESNGQTHMLFVDAGNDRVGIGASSPAHIVHIADASAPELIVEDTTNNVKTLIGAGNTIGRIGTGSNHPLVVDINDSEKIRIDSSGRLLVGTTTEGHANGDNLTLSDSGDCGLTIRSENSGEGVIYFSDATSGSGEFAGQVSYIHSADALRFASAGSERLRIDSSGNVGLGTTSPTDHNGFTRIIDISGGGGGAVYCRTGTSTSNVAIFGQSGSDVYIVNKASGNTRFNVADAEKMRLDSSGRLLIGASTATLDQTWAKLQLRSTDGAALVLAREDATVTVNEDIGSIRFYANDAGSYHECAKISAEADDAFGSSSKPSSLRFFTTDTGASSPTQRMIINSGGYISNKTSNIGSISGAGMTLDPNGAGVFTVDSNNVIYANRLSNDGYLVKFYQANSLEGDISVSGSTVSYNGGHLSRWSQLAGGAARTEILRGSVLSNLDEMCEWGEEDNEQLNRMKVSDVEGDPNVAGVFQGWDDEDETYANDFYCAMTGDFVIRIAQGTTVARGDLLMSAGDGTAKPQDDDIVRSKTIAKVTSTTVSTTYSDGSYCVPCVLMAC